MKTILVPTDFSENAANAVEYAAEFAATSESNIILLHVYTPAPPAYGIGELAKELIRAKEEIHKRLEVVCNAIREEYSSIHCASIVKEGEVVREIIKTAEETKANLIFMGTQGESGFDKIIFGTNTQAVIEKTMCPVFAIPASAPFVIPEKVLFATNFSYGNVKGAVELTNLVELFNPSIIIGHVQLGNEAVDPQKSIEKFSQEIRWLTDYPKISYKIFNEKTVAKGLDGLIEETGADMIALSTRKRKLFERLFNPSVTKKFAAHSRIPLLAFHSTHDDVDDLTIDF